LIVFGPSKGIFCPLVGKRKYLRKGKKGRKRVGEKSVGKNAPLKELRPK